CRGGERLEVLALALAARDQHDRLREALERPQGRVDVRALLIVVVLDAGEVAYPFDPMGHAAEAADRRADRRRGDTRPEGARRRRQHVLDVVLAAQEDLRQGADLLDVTVELRRDLAVADEDPVRQLAAP